MSRHAILSEENSSQYDVDGVLGVFDSVGQAVRSPDKRCYCFTIDVWDGPDLVERHNPSLCSPEWKRHR